jgi:hypothetical protein
MWFFRRKRKKEVKPESSFNAAANTANQQNLEYILNQEEAGIARAQGDLNANIKAYNECSDDFGRKRIAQKGQTLLQRLKNAFADWQRTFNALENAINLGGLILAQGKIENLKKFSEHNAKMVQDFANSVLMMEQGYDQSIKEIDVILNLAQSERHSNLSYGSGTSEFEAMAHSVAMQKDVANFGGVNANGDVDEYQVLVDLAKKKGDI